MQTQVTVSTLHRMKQAGQKIACITAYDASFAERANAAGMDVILVGDSLGMVVQGQSSTVPVSVDDMVYHSKMVARTNAKALLMVDMPFMSYRNAQQALKNAARLMQEGGAEMVKLETNSSQLAIISSLIDAGVPVCAHLGLRPQSINKLGGYKVQGRDQASADAMCAEAEQLAKAGADCLLLECVPAPLAQTISQLVPIPVIGCGAGVHCDGQVLVLYDILGISTGKRPKFSKDFLAGANSIEAALVDYVNAVRSGEFPTPAHSFGLETARQTDESTNKPY